MTSSEHLEQLKLVRVQTQSDLDLQLSLFANALKRLVSENDTAPATDQALKIRQFLSHAVHVLTTASAWAFASSRADLRKVLLETIRDALADARFAPSDFDHSVSGLSEKLVDARAYPLIVAALRADRPELVDMARTSSPIDQAELFARFSVAPANEAEKDLETALNQYARNERVRVASPIPASATKSTRAPRLVLHAGITKTGSTRIQNYLDMNRPALLRRGIWVPERGIFSQPGRPHKQAGHSRFVQAAVRGNRTLRKYVRRGVQTASGAIHTIVLSSEGFFLNQRSHQIPAYLGDFSAEVLIYLRRQDEWANSQYCEFVGGGAVGRVSETFDDWVAQPKTQKRMDYRRVLARFAKALGKEHVQARVYDRKAVPEGDIIADFADALALPELLDLPRPDSGGSNEPRISAPHIEALREFNDRKFASTHVYLGFVEDVTRRLSDWRRDQGIPMPPPKVVSPEARQRLIGRYAEINAQIARDWLGRADGHLFDGTMPGAAEETPPLFPEELEILESAYERWRRHSDTSLRSMIAKSLSKTRPGVV